MPGEKNVFVSDLDGTLLNQHGALSPFARRALTALLEQGLCFTVASARSLLSISRLLDDLPLDLPVVGLGGATVSHWRTGQHLWVQAIAPDHLWRLHGVMARHGCQPFVSSFDGERDRLYMPPAANPGMAWYHADRHRLQDPRLVPTRDPTEAFDQQVLSLNAVCDAPTARALWRDLEQAVGGEVQLHLYDNMYQRGWFWLTAHHQDATKSQAVKKLLAHCGLPVDGLTVFGDDLNDLCLMDLAPTAVAVQNAHDEVKARATRHIGPNHEDSVVRYLLEVGKQEWEGAAD